MAEFRNVSRVVSAVRKSVVEVQDVSIDALLLGQEYPWSREATDRHAIGGRVLSQAALDPPAAPPCAASSGYTWPTALAIARAVGHISDRETRRQGFSGDDVWGCVVR